MRWSENSGLEPEIFQSPLFRLMTGIRAGASVEEAQRLIDEGANPKRIHSRWSRSLCSPLMQAVICDRADLVELLIPLSDPNARDAEGATALIVAAETGNEAAVQALLPVSDPRLRDRRGDTALSVALTQGGDRFEMIMSLLPSLIPGQVDRRGNTPLMGALAAGATPALIHLIVDAGANPDTANDKGETPLSFAVSKAMEEQAQALMSRMSPAARREALEFALALCERKGDGHEPARARIAQAAESLKEREALLGLTMAAGARGAPRL